MPAERAGLEVHEHAVVTGPRAYHSGCNKIVHSHQGGDVPHAHLDTGPACYTIDRDEWFRATGLRGGGRKKFTKRPTGEQLPIRELEDWQKSFEVVVGLPPKDHLGAGPGIAPAARMILGFGMTIAAVRGNDNQPKARR